MKQPFMAREDVRSSIHTDLHKQELAAEQLIRVNLYAHYLCFTHQLTIMYFIMHISLARSWDQLGCPHKTL